MQKAPADFCDILRSYDFSGLTGSTLSGPGFSFGYGESAGEKWRRNFTVKSSKLKKVEEFDMLKVIFEHCETPLEVTALYKIYKEYKVVEYKLTFTNTGDEKLPPLKNLSSVDFTLDLSEAEEPIIHNISSGACPWLYPPSAYRHQKIEIYPDLLNPRQVPYWAGEVELSRGRIDSAQDYSSGNLPFVFIQDRKDTSGIFLALGWEGDWKIKIRKAHDSRLYRVSGDVPDINIALYPRESITGPSVFLGEYVGDEFDGSNALRRFIDDILMDDCPFPDRLPPVSYDHWFGYGLDINDKIVYQLADILEDVGTEYFILDAGWYSGVGEGPGGYMRGVGNWTVDNEKFPDGLKQIADYVRNKGMKFGIWIAPEKPWKGTETARKHPEWLLSFPGRDGYLLDFRKEEAREWYKETLARFIEKVGVDWIRIESLGEYNEYWNANEKQKDRKGAMQFHYIEGLYKIWQWLKEAYPDRVIELLSPMGMETFRYADSLLASDMNMNPHIIRAHLHGTNRLIGGGYTNGMFVPSTLDYEDYPDYYYHSFFGGALQISDPLTEWSGERLNALKKHVHVYKKVRHLLNKDFYLPFGDPLTLDEWQGWQFYDRHSGEGVLIAFRLRSEKETVSVKLRGISPQKDYVLEDPYTGNDNGISGKKLSSKGLALNLPKYGSEVIYYYEKE